MSIRLYSLYEVPENVNMYPGSLIICDKKYPIPYTTKEVEGDSVLVPETTLNLGYSNMMDSDPYGCIFSYRAKFTSSMNSLQ